MLNEFLLDAGENTFQINIVKAAVESCVKNVNVILWITNSRIGNWLQNFKTYEGNTRLPL